MPTYGATSASPSIDFATAMAGPSAISVFGPKVEGFGGLPLDLQFTLALSMDFATLEGLSDTGFTFRSNGVPYSFNGPPASHFLGIGDWSSVLQYMRSPAMIERLNIVNELRAMGVTYDGKGNGLLNGQPFDLTAYYGNRLDGLSEQAPGTTFTPAKPNLAQGPRGKAASTTEQNTQMIGQLLQGTSTEQAASQMMVQMIQTQQAGGEVNTMLSQMAAGQPTTQTGGNAPNWPGRTTGASYSGGTQTPSRGYAPGQVPGYAPQTPGQNPATLPRSGTGTGTGTTTRPGTGTAEQNNAFGYINELLAMYGMESLGNWAWDQIVQGNSADQIIQSLRQRPEYAKRFPGMALRRENGLNAISEGEYVAYERQTQQLMRAAGMPEGFWDQESDYASLIGNDVSLNELNQRISNAYVRVAYAPPEVRNAFNNFFGVDGDAAFAAYFLDPDRAMPILDSAVTQAEIAGTGTRFGIGVDQNMAQRLQGIGVDLKQANQGFGQLSLQPGLYRESVTEGEDYTAEREGIAGTFGLDATSANRLQQRRDVRQAAFSGTTNQALATQQGLVGIGSSR